MVVSLFSYQSESDIDSDNVVPTELFSHLASIRSYCTTLTWAHNAINP